MEKQESHETQKPLKAEVVVNNKQGLHLRIAGGLSVLAGRYQSKITIAKGRKGVDAKSMLDIVSLSAAPGTKLSVTASGADAAGALAAITGFFQTNLGK